MLRITISTTYKSKNEKNNKKKLLNFIYKILKKKINFK